MQEYERPSRDPLCGDIFTVEPGRGNVADRDRGQRTDDRVGGELAPDAAGVIPHSPPAPDPGG